MFSQLGPLFKTTLRQAESADTRLEIRRDEKQGQGRKNDYEDSQDDTSALWEDSATVSVEALRTFLMEFLKTRGLETPSVTGEMAENTLPPLTPEYRPPANSTAARAVKAYAASSSSTPSYVPQPPAEEKTETVDLASLLRADELRTIHVLIAELDQLARRGVTLLTIEKADSFLESLVTAVTAEKVRG